jgi:hypothetical protein
MFQILVLVCPFERRSWCQKRTHSSRKLTFENILVTLQSWSKQKLTIKHPRAMQNDHSLPHIPTDLSLKTWKHALPSSITSTSPHPGIIIHPSLTLYIDFPPTFTYSKISHSSDRLEIQTNAFENNARAPGILARGWRNMCWWYQPAI